MSSSPITGYENVPVPPAQPDQNQPPAGSSHSDYFALGQEIVSTIFSDSNLATPENFAAARDYFQQAKEARMKELGLPVTGNLTPEQQAIADNDPFLNYYNSMIDWADKWVVSAEAYGELPPGLAYTALREYTSVNEMFWLSYASVGNLDPAEREQALAKATEFGEQLAFLQSRMDEIRRVAFGG